MITTRGRGRERTCGRPTEASRPSWRGPRSCRPRAARRRSATSSPRCRTCSSRCGARVIRTVATPPSVHSTGTIASAPCGTGAPVMIRTVVPGREREQLGLPGRHLADHRQVHRVVLGGGGDVVEVDRVAVHRRVVEGRQVHRRDDRPRRPAGRAPPAAAGRTAAAARAASRIRSTCSSTVLSRSVGIGRAAHGRDPRPSRRRSRTVPPTRPRRPRRGAPRPPRDVGPKVQSPSTDELVGAPQRRHAVGEPRVEVADQLVERCRGRRTAPSVAGRRRARGGASVSS